ncbi:nucleolus and neural progenitor protein isoform 2-T2 [Clarias gariepinus]|uniref:nucleolus and neural progenitor protein isoform X2 n=1 Tax=Clarias gariepinus TaxID=13013 RepID=UPI00234CDB18|nr:nucleolus and neural progenitor protein isoform X2 [Clarias gariepinus]
MSCRTNSDSTHLSAPSSRNVGLDSGHCDIPSQPMLEWFCLKLLGASSLLCRTLDQCTKAFSLTRQHLYLAEFIVLNIVLASMLSRLWVFFRGILRALVPVYQSIMVLLQEVVQCRPMAFLTDFTLPEDMAVFLGSPYSQMLKESSIAEPLGTKKTTKRSILDQLFEEGSEEQLQKGEEKEREMMQMLASEEMTANTDLGRTILRQGPFCSRSSSMLDLKSMLQQTSKQYTAEVFIKRPSPGQPSTSSLSALEQKRMFLKKLKTASSVKDTAALIEEMMSWCSSCKLYKEHHYLAFMLLKSQRINALECTGISVQKKLRRLRVSVHHVMRKGITLARSSILHHRRTKCFFRTRFSALLRCNGNARSKVGKARMDSKIVKDLFNVSAKSSHKSRKHTGLSSLHKDVMSGSNVLFSQKESNMKTNITSLKSSNVRNDEIDNIFASFGL